MLSAILMLGSYCCNFTSITAVWTQRWARHATKHLLMKFSVSEGQPLWVGQKKQCCFKAEKVSKAEITYFNLIFAAVHSAPREAWSARHDNGRYPYNGYHGYHIDNHYIRNDHSRHPTMLVEDVEGQDGWEHDGRHKRYASHFSKDISCKGQYRKTYKSPSWWHMEVREVKPIDTIHQMRHAWNFYIAIQISVVTETEIKLLRKRQM